VSKLRWSVGTFSMQQPCFKSRQSMWNLQWAKWDRHRLFCKYFSILQSVALHLCSILIHTFIYASITIVT
jgi:hypothetical protein